MSDSKDHHEGGCFCGAVRYKITGMPDWSSHCHCRSCQRAVGAAYTTWIGVKTENFEVTKGEISTFTLAGAERGFCSSCGTSLTYIAEEGWPGQVSLLAPTLDEPGIASQSAHVYLDHKLPWVKLGDELEQYSQFPWIFVPQRRKPCELSTMSETGRKSSLTSMLRISPLGTFPSLKNQFWALAFSKGDTEIRIVGGRERHTTNIDVNVWVLVVGRKRWEHSLRGLCSRTTETSGHGVRPFAPIKTQLRSASQARGISSTNDEAQELPFLFLVCFQFLKSNLRRYR